MDFYKILTMQIAFGIALLFSVDAYGQHQLTKTSEFYDDGIKRRELFLDENLKVVKEIYYHKSSNATEAQNPFFEIDYHNDSIQKFTSYLDGGSKIQVDYKDGTYIEGKNGIVLRFKNDFIFNGLQEGANIVVNYKGGYKSGRLIQADSAEDGTRSVPIKLLDTRYLRFNIFKYYVAFDEEKTYKLFRGVLLNFNAGKLNGNQEAFYENGNAKIKAKFHNDLLDTYASFTMDGASITKVVGKSGIVFGNQIINGSVHNFSVPSVIWFNKLLSVGNILSTEQIQGVSEFDIPTELQREFLQSGFFIESGQKLYAKDATIFHQEIKKVFDTKKIEPNEELIHLIYGIPHFYIQRFDFDNNDATTFYSVPLDNIIVTDSTIEAKKVNIDGYEWRQPMFEPTWERNSPLVFSEEETNRLNSDEEDSLKKQFERWFYFCYEAKTNFPFQYSFSDFMTRSVPRVLYTLSDQKEFLLKFVRDLKKSKVAIKSNRYEWYVSYLDNLGSFYSLYPIILIDGEDVIQFNIENWDNRVPIGYKFVCKFGLDNRKFIVVGNDSSSFILREYKPNDEKIILLEQNLHVKK